MRWKLTDQTGTPTYVVVLDPKEWPTLEVIIRETPAVLRKTHRPDLGLALIDLAR